MIVGISLRRMVLLDTKGNYMKESNILGGQCGKEYSQEGYLAEHQMIVHKGIKYPCR